MLLNPKMGNNLNMNGQTIYNLPTTGNVDNNMALSWHQIKERTDYVHEHCEFRFNNTQNQCIGYFPGSDVLFCHACIAFHIIC